MIQLEEKQKNFWVAGLLLILFTPLYLFTMNPSVSVGDSGEFIAAAANLSLPHAPSYPLFSLLGKCALLINPFANAAYRMNFLCLIFGVSSGIVFFFLARSGLKLSLPAAAVSAAIFMSSQVQWEHSLGTEVFTLNSLFALLILTAVTAKAREVPLSRRIRMASFLLGLGLGNHHTLVLVSIPMALLYLGERVQSEPGSRMKAFWIDFLSSLGFFLLGFSIYAFLPIRSRINPPLDWSNPENLENFIRVITRADYGSLSLTLGEKLPRNLATTLKQAWRYLAYAGNDITFAGLAAAFLGWILWLKKDAKQCLAFLAFFLMSGIGFLVLGNLPFDAQSNGILPRFYMLPAIPLALALAYLLDWLNQKFSPKLAALFILFPIYLIFRPLGTRAFSRHDFTSNDYGRNMLKTLPPGAVLFMDGGDDTFYSLAYLTMVEKRRPDLELHDRGGLIYKNPYGDDFRRIPKSEKEMRRQTVEGSFLGIRPLYYATFDKKILKGAELRAKGLLYEAIPAHAQPAQSVTNSPADRAWNFYSTRGIYEERERTFRLRALVPLYPFLEGLSKWDLKFLRRAMGFGTDVAWLKANLVWEASLKAFEATNQNRLDEAQELYRFVLEADPNNVSAYTN